MKVLVSGDIQQVCSFLRTFKTDGVTIELWNGESDPVLKYYDWLLLVDPDTPTNQKLRTDLASQQLDTPVVHICPPKKESPPKPVLLGAIERNLSGEKVLNCKLSTHPTPHQTKNPFGEIIYEYHAPCRA